MQQRELNQITTDPLCGLHPQIGIDYAINIGFCCIRYLVIFGPGVEEPRDTRLRNSEQKSPGIDLGYLNRGPTVRFYQTLAIVYCLLIKLRSRFNH